MTWKHYGSLHGVKHDSNIQGEHSPDNVKFPDISMTVCGTPLRHPGRPAARLYRRRHEQTTCRASLPMREQFVPGEDELLSHYRSTIGCRFI